MATEGVDFVICQLCGNKFYRITHGHLTNKHGITMPEYKVLFLNALTKSKMLKPKEPKKPLESYVVCRICGGRFKRIAHRHLVEKHSITSEEYRDLFPEAEFVCSKWRKQHSHDMEQLHRDPESAYNTPSYKHALTVRMKDLWENHRNVMHTPERSMKISEKVKAFYANPHNKKYIEEVQKRRTKSLKRAWADPRSGFNSPERGRKISETQRRQRNTPEWHKFQSELTKRQWENPDSPSNIIRRRNIAKGVARARERGCYNLARTSIELAVRDILDDLGVEYREQVRIDTKFVDFLVENDIIVEAYGDHWHSLDPEGDKERENILRGFGYQFIALWGSEIRKYPQECGQKILQLLEEEYKDASICDFR